MKFIKTTNKEEVTAYQSRHHFFGTPFLRGIKLCIDKKKEDLIKNTYYYYNKRIDEFKLDEEDALESILLLHRDIDVKEFKGWKVSSNDFMKIIKSREFRESVRAILKEELSILHKEDIDSLEVGTFSGPIEDIIRIYSEALPENLSFFIRIKYKLFSGELVLDKSDFYFSEEQALHLIKLIEENQGIDIL
jgi:hypothetical protein